MKILILLALLLQACGKDDANTSNNKTEATKTEPSTSTSSDPAQYAVAIDQLADAPSCNSNKKYLLIYVKSSGLFYSCNGSTYDSIDIKGKDGKAGNDGVAGVKGETGSTGATGPAGSPTPSNVWYDSITSKYWLIGGLYSNYLFYQNSCTGNYRTATKTETSTAMSHGIWSKVQLQTSEKRAYMSDDSANVMAVDNGAQTGIVGGTPYLILCISI